MKNPNMNPNDEIEKNQYGNNLVFQQFFSVLSLGQKLFLFLPSFFAIHLHIARNLIKHVSFNYRFGWDGLSNININNDCQTFQSNKKLNSRQQKSQDHKLVVHNRPFLHNNVKQHPD